MPAGILTLKLAPYEAALGRIAMSRPVTAEQWDAVLGMLDRVGGGGGCGPMPAVSYGTGGSGPTPSGGGGIPRVSVKFTDVPVVSMNAQELRSELNTMSAACVLAMRQRDLLVAALQEIAQQTSAAYTRTVALQALTLLDSK